ncbi:hypothetical protein B0H16DRAFT_1461287 [Mycena metata]|uniref:F-box domain-containing protein n=1 Tax=Mycena metata TaxID=1033252 RepID=A0AAD7IS37_9AGAR|nr:hypothetical protein B0H16DRAFT_1461287 [Mycena metata]
MFQTATRLPSSFMAEPVVRIFIGFASSSFSNVTKAHRDWCLPPEIWIIIFEMVLSAWSSNFAAYNERKEIVSSCSPEWRGFIQSKGEFWTRLSITCRSSIQFVSDYLTHTLPTINLLDVTIMFDIDEVMGNRTYLGGSLDEEEMATHLACAVACLEAVVPTIYRWRAVHLSSNVDCFMGAILRAIRDVPAPNVTSLVLSFPTRGKQGHCSRIFDPPSDVFGGILPNLTSLRLRNAALPWGVASYFNRLVYFDIGDIPASAWPTPTELASALEASPVLARINIGGGGVLDFGELSVTHLDDAAWQALLAAGFLGQLDTVRIAGWVSDDRHVDTLLSSLTRMVSLDVHLARPQEYFARMLQFPRLCPTLKNLCVGPVQLSDISWYIAHRKLLFNPGLDRVEYHHRLQMPVSPHDVRMLSASRNFLTRFCTVPNAEIGLYKAVVAVVEESTTAVQLIPDL